MSSTFASNWRHDEPIFIRVSRAGQLDGGLLLITLILIVQAVGVVMMALAGAKLRSWLATRKLRLRRIIPALVCTISVVGMLLAALEGTGPGIWAVAYLRLGALHSMNDALYYSVGSMATRGTTGRPMPLNHAGFRAAVRTHAQISASWGYGDV